MKNYPSRLFLTLFVLYFLSSCASSTSTSTPALPGYTATTDPSVGVASVTLPAPVATAILPTAEPSPTPTRTHAAPVDWREVPIMPEVSPHVYQIFAAGQALGRDPQSFSVIGDCQSIPFVFMGPYGRGELEPAPAESYLWNAIGFFDASFKRWSVTSRGGFTAASLLTPIQADPHVCKPGETPLTCEYRLNNPAYVFITLETWLDPQTIDRYEFYLRQILEYVLAQGSIPILLTKADAAEVDDGSHVINPAMVRVARDYDVPLVNFWRAAQYIDNAGIDPNRDGFHLSQQGYNLKNTLALRALYTVWQAVGQGTTAALTPGASLPTPTPTPILSAGPEPVIPACQGGCIFFGTAASHDGQVASNGVYAYQVATQQLTRVLGEGFDLQDVSEDGLRLLVNQQNFLYEISLSDATSRLVTDSFYWLGEQGAYWDSTDAGIILIDAAHPFQTTNGGAITLFPSSRDGEVMFETGACTSKDFCQPAGILRLEQDQTASPMPSYARPEFSPAGDWMAFLNPDAANRDNFFHIGYLLLENPDNSTTSRRIIYFPGEGGFMVYPDVRTYAFSPTGDQLFVIYDIYSAYFERSLRMQTYLFDLASGVLIDFGKLEGISGSLDPHLVWSPQGDRILFFLTELDDENQFTLNVYQTDLSSGEKLILTDPQILSSQDYIYITNLYWR